MGQRSYEEMFRSLGGRKIMSEVAECSTRARETEMDEVESDLACWMNTCPDGSYLAIRRHPAG